VSAFSIFSELTFLVDSWTWSVDQVPMSIKVIALAIGEYVSGIVGGYREFAHGLVRMLHLPKFPQFAYDLVGVMAFSVGATITFFRQRAYRLRTGRAYKQAKAVSYLLMGAEFLAGLLAVALVLWFVLLLSVGEQSAFNPTIVIAMVAAIVILLLI